MRKLLGLLALFLCCSSLHADLYSTHTLEQAKDDVRLFLKQIHKANSRFFAEYGRNASNINELSKTGLKIPAYISSLGKPYIYSGPSLNRSVRILFYTSNPIFRTRGALPVFEISSQGVLLGLTQWNSASELVQEIDDTLNGILNAEKSYYVEFNKYSTDWTAIGYLVPSYLRPYGTFSLRINPNGSFVGEFKGLKFPVVGYVNSVTANPSHVCVPPQIVVGLDSAGKPICQDPPIEQECPAGKEVAGYSADGSLICHTVHNHCRSGWVHMGTNLQTGGAICFNPASDRSSNCKAPEVKIASDDEGALICGFYTPPSPR